MTSASDLPHVRGVRQQYANLHHRRILVGAVGIEPTQSYLHATRLQRAYLSKECAPEFCLVLPVGFEPTRR